MTLRVWFVFALFLATVFTTAPVYAQRPEPGTVRMLGVTRDGDRDVIRVRVGTNVPMQRLVRIANDGASSGAPAVTVEDIVRENPGRVIYVCGSRLGIPRSFSRRPEQWLACPGARHGYWLVDGLVYRIPRQHAPSAEERLVTVLQELADTREHLATVEATLANQSTSHVTTLPTINIVGRAPRHRTEATATVGSSERLRWFDFGIGVLMGIGFLCLFLWPLKSYWDAKWLAWSERQLRRERESFGKASAGEREALISDYDRRIEVVRRDLQDASTKALNEQELVKELEQKLLAQTTQARGAETRAASLERELADMQTRAEAAERKLVLAERDRAQMNDRRERAQAMHNKLATASFNLKQAEKELGAIALLHRDFARLYPDDPGLYATTTDQMERSKTEVDILREERETMLRVLEDDLAALTGLACHPGEYLADVGQQDRERRTLERRCNDLVRRVESLERDNGNLDAALIRSALLYTSTLDEKMALESEVASLNAQLELHVKDILSRDSRLHTYKEYVDQTLHSWGDILSSVPPPPDHDGVRVLTSHHQEILSLGMTFTRVLDLVVAKPGTAIEFDRVAHHEAIHFVGLDVVCLACRETHARKTTVKFGNLATHYRRKHEGLPNRLRAPTIAPPGL